MKVEKDGIVYDITDPFKLEIFLENGYVECKKGVNHGKTVETKDKVEQTG